MKHSQFSESPSQFGVVISGPSINLTRTFTARGNSSILQSLPIMDDFFGRENNEQYDIQLIGSSPSADITTRGTTTITISDDDGILGVYLFLNCASLFF